MDDKNVSLTISKEIVNPIVEAKIKEAVLEALGGKEKLVAQVVDHVINQKVNSAGKVGNYSSDNKFNWLDIMVTKQLQDTVRAELVEQISEASSEIKKALIGQLRTKRGSNMVARALIDGLGKSFAETWRSQVNISINPLKDN